MIAHLLLRFVCLTLRALQGNRSGAVGCGFWNNDCGGLDLVLVWQIAYCIIAGLVVVIIPFFIFYYENDDEGMGSREGSEGSMVAAASIRFKSFKASLCSACIYTFICLVIGVIAFFVLYHYIATTRMPYKLIQVGVGSSAFQEAPAAFVARCPTTPGSTAVCPCGTGTCTAADSILEMEVTIVIFLAAIMSFVGWFLFSIYVGIGFIAMPLDCFNAFIHRPKMLSTSEARNQRKVLMKRSEELIKVGDEMAKRLIDAQDGAKNKSERKNAVKVHKVEVNRFKLLVDLLEKDLEEFQLGDPQNYK
jgi:LMBR1 domain-containing protein 1